MRVSRIMVWSCGIKTPTLVAFSSGEVVPFIPLRYIRTGIGLRISNRGYLPPFEHLWSGFSVHCRVMALLRPKIGDETEAILQIQSDVRA